jgi:hypothetical protein
VVPEAGAPIAQTTFHPHSRQPVKAVTLQLSAGREPDRAPLKWRDIVVVCGECEQRKDGPRHLGAKDARRALKHHLRDAASEARVVVSGCLGPCVKKALTVVAVGAFAGRHPLAFAVCREDDLGALARRLAQPLASPTIEAAAVVSVG